MRDILWSPDTRRRERLGRIIIWQAVLMNGDVQVIYEEDDLSLPNPFYPSPDPRLCHPQRYYLGIWNEGVFEPMAQLWHDFDVRRFLVGYARLEEEQGMSDPLSGLFRHPEADQRPLFHRGYEAAAPHRDPARFPHLWHGSTTREWYRGYHAGSDDRWLRDGRVNTGRKSQSCMESIECVKWLL